jgi:tetratricopeptide (TPR) repeat protein
VEQDNAGALSAALERYKESLTLFMQLLKETTDAGEKNQLMIRVDAYMKRAEQIKTQIRAGDAQRAAKLPPAPPMDCINALLLVNASSAKLRQGIKLISQAVSHDNDGRHREAMRLYTTAMENLMGGLREERNAPARTAIMQNLDTFLDRAEALKAAGFK